MSAKWNLSGAVPDAALREIARKFLKFQPFPDGDHERGLDMVGRGDGVKHFTKFPQMNKWAVKRFIDGRWHYLAYVGPGQIDDGLRFADATTYRFWKYRKRCAHLMDESHFNFSIAATEADLDSWPHEMPEVIAMIDELEKHFIDAGLFVDPAKRPPPDRNPHSAVARRTLRGELRSMSAVAQERHLELIDRIDGLEKKLAALEERNVITTSGTLPVLPPFSVTT